MPTREIQLLRAQTYKMADHMYDEFHGHMWWMLFGVTIMVTVLILLFIFFARKIDGRELSLPREALVGRPAPRTLLPTDPSEPARDTIFVLPDISGYTRFLTLNQFGLDHARHVIFSLLNAVLDTGTEKLELSKLEGDAALFVCEANTLEPAELGRHLVQMIARFDQTKTALSHANLCPCQVCRHILDLDLKIFVHRGAATRFEFLGTVDVFGADAIVLHRLMKNQVQSRRYIMVTGAARNCISLPLECQTTETHVEAEHVGRIGASVFNLPQSLPDCESVRTELPGFNPTNDLLSKLGRNARSLWSRLRILERKQQGEEHA